MRGADVGSDHHLLVFRMKLKLKRTSPQSVNQRKVFNTTLLRDKTQQNDFRITLNNRFQALEKLIEDETVEEQCKVIKETVTSSCPQILGTKKYTHKDRTTRKTPEKTDERKNRKAELKNSRAHSEKIGERIGSIHRGQQNGEEEH